jgi:hypothetical protein
MNIKYILCICFWHSLHFLATLSRSTTTITYALESIRYNQIGCLYACLTLFQKHILFIFLKCQWISSLLRRLLSFHNLFYRYVGFVLPIVQIYTFVCNLMKHSRTNVFRLQYITLYLFIFQIERQKKHLKF